MLMQITFFRVSRVPKGCSGSFNLSNAWTNMWNKMMDEKAGVKRQRGGSFRGFRSDSENSKLV